MSWISTRDAAGAKALIAAAKTGKIRLNSRSRDSTRATLLMEAVNGGLIDDARWLIEAGEDVNAPLTQGWTALMLACDLGNVPMVKLLIKWGTNVNQTNKQEVPPLTMEHTDESAVTAFMVARPVACERNLDMLKYFVETNVDVKDGIAPLMYACMTRNDVGAPDIARSLVPHGAEVNPADKDGKTALDHAIGKRNFRLVQMLLAAGAEMQAPLKL